MGQPLMEEDPRVLTYNHTRAQPYAGGVLSARAVHRPVSSWRLYA